MQMPIFFETCLPGFVQKNIADRAKILFEEKKKLGLQFILNPNIIPYSGLYLDEDEQKLAFQGESDIKKIIYQFVDELPTYDGLRLQLHPDIKFVLPFIWRGFAVKPRFTYRLNLKNHSEKNYKPSLKRNIKKAQSIFTLEEAETVDSLYDLKVENSNQQITPLTFNQESLAQMHRFYKSKNAGKILVAKKGSEVVGAIFYVYNAYEAYYLVGGSHPDYRNSGVSGLLLHEAICDVKNKSEVFDFEGSMIEGVAHFFSGFNAICTPYYQIEHFPNTLAKMAIEGKKWILGK